MQILTTKERTDINTYTYKVNTWNTQTLKPNRAAHKCGVNEMKCNPLFLDNVNNPQVSSRLVPMLPHRETSLG